MKKVNEILDSLASPTPSEWREKAEWRKANKQWLRKSQKIALTLLECMSSKKMTQKQLAEMMDVSPQYVSRILKGSENLSLDTISKIENVLGIEILTINSYATQQEIAPMWQNIATPKFSNSIHMDAITESMEYYSSYSKPENPLVA